MINIAIPGAGELNLKYLVMDYNGTLAIDGKLIRGVKEGLEALSDKLDSFVVTADTFGKARSELRGLPCELTVLPEGAQDIGKLEYIKRLGCENTVCIGNGRNDRLMLKEAGLGIAVVLEEGAATETVLSADIVCTCVVSALNLLANPLRLVATLRF